MWVLVGARVIKQDSYRYMALYYPSVLLQSSRQPRQQCCVVFWLMDELFD